MPQYSIETEFNYLQAKNPTHILDAGCGTGIAARFLRQKYPTSQITGGDFSEIRIQQAKEYCKNHNIDFRSINLLETFASEEFDLISCRYVLGNL